MSIHATRTGLMQAHPSDATAYRSGPVPSRWRHVWYAVEVVGQAAFLLFLILAVLVVGAGMGAVLGVEMR